MLPPSPGLFFNLSTPISLFARFAFKAEPFLILSVPVGAILLTLSGDILSHVPAACPSLVEPACLETFVRCIRVFFYFFGLATSHPLSPDLNETQNFKLIFHGRP